MAVALINLPSRIQKGVTFEVRTTVAHPMETGYRSGDDGRVRPRNIIRTFSCELDGRIVFEAELHAAIAANPYIAFFVTTQQNGKLRFTWKGDEGFNHVEERSIVLA